MPVDAEGWFVIPRFEKVGKTYNAAVKTVLIKIASSRNFRNYCKGNLGPKHLRFSERTAVALEMLGKEQEGDFLLIPAQFGLTHRGQRKESISGGASCGGPDRPDPRRPWPL